MKKQSTVLIHIKELESGEFECIFEGGGERILMILTSVLLTDQALHKVFHAAVHLADDMRERHTAGEIDVTKAIKVVEKKAGVH